MWRIRGVIRLVGISLFFALAVMPIVDAIDGRVRAPRALIILIVYVALRCRWVSWSGSST
jgi:hypothetical protein